LKKILWMGTQPPEAVRLRLASSGYLVTCHVGTAGSPDIVIVDEPPGGAGVKVFAPSLELRTMFERALKSASPDASERSAPAELMVGSSAAMTHLRNVMQKLLASPHTSLLLKGEPGSGKRTFARALHAAGGHISELLELNEPKQLEMLRRETAARGPTTVYLGDLTRISAPVQSRLQRLLDARPSREAPTRFVAAVTGDLDSALRGGDLRPALLNRFSVTLHIPPLRERLDDIHVLSQHLAADIAREHGLEPPQLSPDVLRVLGQRTWPGNVTELRNALETGILQAHEQPLLPEHLPSREPSAVKFRLPASGLDLRALEREVLTQALRLARGNRTRAASLLGLTRDQVRYRLSKLDDDYEVA
jgi:DNA-binding NtrC family response regulator